ncbi:AraC family transcriptional regulator [Opitutaceae bacterium TAV5]|nr:AraC family transcriptional regulator [Opitutaceae bacterium TAV5]
MPANHTPESAPHHHPPHNILLPAALHTWRKEVFCQGGVAVLREHLRSNRFAWHRHDQLQFLLVLGGAVCEAEWKTREDESIARKLTGETVWMMPPGRPHALRWHREAELLVLYCDRAWAERFGKIPTEVSVEPLAHYVQHGPLVAELCHELRNTCHDRNPRADDVAALGLSLATRLLGTHYAHSPRGPKGWNIMPGAMRRLLDHIEQNLSEELTVSVLARMAGLSDSYFSEVFRDHTGMPPQLYIVRKRITRAKELLRTGNHTVGEVAHMTGFADQTHMDRYFRQFYGIPPSTWLPKKQDSEESDDDFRNVDKAHPEICA